MGGIALALRLVGLLLFCQTFRRTMEESLREGPEAVVVFWGTYCEGGRLCLNGSWFL